MSYFPRWLSKIITLLCCCLNREKRFIVKKTLNVSVGNSGKLAAFCSLNGHIMYFVLSLKFKQVCSHISDDLRLLKLVKADMNREMS